jgi:hypothetical protein
MFFSNEDFSQCYYLDFLDFGLRRVPPGLPRVKARKNSLVKEFANLDCKAPRDYGLRPVSFVIANLLFYFVFYAFNLISCQWFLLPMLMLFQNTILGQEYFSNYLFNGLCWLMCCTSRF